MVEIENHTAKQSTQQDYSKDECGPIYTKTSKVASSNRICKKSHLKDKTSPLPETMESTTMEKRKTQLRCGVIIE